MSEDDFLIIDFFDDVCNGCCTMCIHAIYNEEPIDINDFYCGLMQEEKENDIDRKV